MKLSRWILVFITLAFIDGLIWAFTKQSIFAGVAYLFSNPWGVMTSADLMLGLVLFSFVIYFNELSKGHAALWIGVVFLLGNVVSAVYLIKSLPMLASKLRVDHQNVT